MENAESILQEKLNAGRSLSKQNLRNDRLPDMKKKVYQLAAAA